jgi:hypothetical protein
LSQRLKSQHMAATAKFFDGDPFSYGTDPGAVVDICSVNRIVVRLSPISYIGEMNAAPHLFSVSTRRSVVVSL